MLLSGSRTGAARTPMFFALVVDDLPRFEQWAAQHGLFVLAKYPPAKVVVVEDRVAHFRDTTLALADLRFADLGHRVAREEMVVPGHNLYVNHIPVALAGRPGLNGAGTTISIKEFRFDSLDVDLKNRVLLTSRSAPQFSIHASAMATLVAGAGNSDPAGRGVARGSRLVSSSFIGLLPDADADYEAFDIAVQNHSYGLDIENYYGAGALAYDQSALEHPQLVHVFSAGNDGEKTSPTGAYAQVDSFANLTGSFKMAKNVLLVGGVDSFGQVLPFSSRGPAYDGRVKPDLVAFGQDGTSGAAALVSGSAAVIRQAFYEKYGFWPSADLVRAVLMGTADDIGPVGPDFYSGYGNLNLESAVDLIENRWMATGNLADGSGEVFTFDLPPQAHQLKVTLVWNDPPAGPNAAKALVNDLDLSVETPDGTFLQPWVLRTYPHRDSLMLPARRGRDTLNTVEQVVLQHPPPGMYRVHVQGRVAAGPAQPYGLAFYWDTLQHFAWTYPLRRRLVEPGQEAVLRWTTTMGDQTGILEWKPAGGGQWRPVSTVIPLGRGFQKWTVPDTVTVALLRMRVNGRELLCDTFLIAPALHVQVGFNCPDSLMLRWPPVAAGAAYRIWGLGDQYLEPLFAISDTIAVLRTDLFPQTRFAVSAIGQEIEGDASGAVAPQSGSCYINTWFALMNSEDRVDLNLDLGTLYGVGKVVLEKQRQGQWQPLYETFPGSFSVRYTDSFPAAGTNVYRARLDMDNGGTLYSAAAQVYFAGKDGILVAPNPVISGQILTVLTRLTDAVPRFILYDMLGRQVLEKALDDSRVQIPLPPLPPGAYYWQLAGDFHEEASRGKLLVRQ